MNTYQTYRTDKSAQYVRIGLESYPFEGWAKIARGERPMKILIGLEIALVLTLFPLATSVIADKVNDHQQLPVEVYCSESLTPKLGSERTITISIPLGRVIVVPLASDGSESTLAFSEASRTCRCRGGSTSGCHVESVRISPFYVLTSCTEDEENPCSAFGCGWETSISLDFDDLF
jgi:hypothetical protein